MKSRDAICQKRGRLIKEQCTGMVFVLPFIIGFIFLFAKPMITSLFYTFNSINIESSGLELQAVGLKNYNTLINDISFLKTVGNEVLRFVWDIPLTLVFSLFVALLLKDRFPGRLMFRCIVFLPVIFASDLIMNLLNKESSMSMTTNDNIYMMVNTEVGDFMQQLLSGFGFGDSFISELTYRVNQVFTLSWNSGIQIVLFIIGLSAIPNDLYEVCQLEGATKWETLWKITFPLLTPTILLCAVFTIIDTFNSGSNAIVSAINETMQVKIEYACVQSWTYSILIALIIGIVYKLISHWTIYLD